MTEYIVDERVKGTVLANLGGCIAHREEDGKTYITIFAYPKYCKKVFKEIEKVAKDKLGIENTIKEIKE